MYRFKANKRIYFCALVLSALCLIGGVGWKYFAHPAKTIDDTPLVKTQVVHIDNSSQQYQYSGEVRSRYESNLAFQTSGKIIRRYVEVGSQVRAGQILMQLDPRDAKQTLDNVAAQLFSAKSQYALAKDNLDRCRQLYQVGAISKVEMDSAQNSFNSAESSLRQVNGQYVLCQNQLQYTNLRADQDGVVTSINGEVGQVVMATATAPTVITLAKNEELEVEIEVPENRINAVSKTKQVKVSFWALPGTTLNGRIREVAPAADPVSKTFNVRVTLLNPPPSIKLGMTSTITIDGLDNKSTTILLPLSAIYQTGNRPQVWVVNNDSVNLRNIEIRSFDHNQVQVVKGLHDGDIVVTAGVHKLIEGQKVRTENAVS